MQYKIHMTAGPTLTIDKSGLKTLSASFMTQGHEALVKLTEIGGNETYINPVHIVQIQIIPTK